MASERAKLVYLYLGGQVVFLCLGGLPGLMFPALFAWFYYRAKKRVRSVSNIDTGLEVAAEKQCTGANVHDVTNLLATYRNICASLDKDPKEAYSLAAKPIWEEALRSFLSGRQTLAQAVAFKREWFERVGYKILHWPSSRRSSD